MYERDPTTTRTAVNNAQARSHAMPLESNDGSSEGSGTHATTPGSIIQSLFLPSDIKQIMSSLEPDSTSSEGVISKFSEQYGLQFTVANELQGTTEAFCALFWEPKEKFVIVAFMWVFLSNLLSVMKLIDIETGREGERTLSRSTCE